MDYLLLLRRGHAIERRELELDGVRRRQVVQPIGRVIKLLCCHRVLMGEKRRLNPVFSPRVLTFLH